VGVGDPSHGGDGNARLRLLLQPADILGLTHLQRAVLVTRIGESKRREKASHREERDMLLFGLRMVPDVCYGRIRGPFAVYSVRAFCYS
jgi:hypothetical protein